MVIAALAGIVLAPVGVVALPEACPGWTASAQRIVTPANVFDYMNGAGELYLAYGFEDLQVREYTQSPGRRITCEVYRMPGASDAFGLFSQDRTGEEVKIGQGGIYAGGLLIAWQGRHFIRILADSDTEEVKQCVLSLATQIVPQCGPDGALPAALKWLPAKGLDAKSVHFFHTHACLNSLYFLASENILRLSRTTEAVLGSFRTPAGKSIVLVVGYPDAKETSAAWKTFRASYAKDASDYAGLAALKLENGRWLAGNQASKHIVLVLESPARAEAAGLFASVRRQLALVTRDTGDKQK